MPLQPLPQAAITAAKLRRQAQDLILLADELEASCGAGYAPRKVVEFAFKKEPKTKGRKR